MCASKIKKGEKLQDRIKELEAENSRLRRELNEVLTYWREDTEEVLEFNRTYKGGWHGKE